MPLNQALLKKVDMAPARSARLPTRLGRTRLGLVGREPAHRTSSLKAYSITQQQ